MYIQDVPRVRSLNSCDLTVSVFRECSGELSSARLYGLIGTLEIMHFLMHGAINVVLFIFTVIGHFLVPKTLTLKTRLSVNRTFPLKMSFFCMRKKNSKMAYLNLRESCVFSKLLFISIIINLHFCKSLARWVVTSQEKALVHEISLNCIYSGLQLC